MLPSVLIAILLAVITVAILTWRIPSSHFRQIRIVIIALAAALFWDALALVLHTVYWDSYYRYFAPDYVNWLTPLAALFYFVVGLVLSWLALRLPGNPVVNFCLLGGIESIPEHFLAINRLHILDIPSFQGVSAAEIYFFAFFEYIIYWGIVLMLAVLLANLVRLRKVKPA